MPTPTPDLTLDDITEVSPTDAARLAKLRLLRADRIHVWARAQGFVPALWTRADGIAIWDDARGDGLVVVQDAAGNETLTTVEALPVTVARVSGRAA